MNLLCIHLLNNYTGSPKVLANIIKEFSLYKEFSISLLTSQTDGCLSNIPNIHYYTNHYKWINNKLGLAILFVSAQLYMFFFVLVHTKKFDVLYINTVVPFAVALAGVLAHKTIIYHVHEVYIHPNMFQKIMWRTMEKYATKIITVSQYVGTNINRPTTVIYNATSRGFAKKAETYMQNMYAISDKFTQKTILMVASLKKYKGIDIFVSLAQKCPEYSFFMVISSPLDDITDYFAATRLPVNLQLLPQQADLIPYYRNAAIVCNLSIPDLWIETFGLTLIEAFHFGIPCIAPDFGGPKEILTNGVDGFLVNPCDEDTVANAIHAILASEECYAQFCANALKVSQQFSIDFAIRQLIAVISE
ncbi:hypothetical protein FACS189450_12610 [Spirochaetia bacterium]|nr:hypothetical protein FACS189450_12610 [Spirochaetia bacterium]